MATESESFPRPIRTRRRFSGLLAATALGVYLLLIVGATTSLTDAAAACSTWPTCHAPADPLNQTQLVVAWGHRLAAVLVGLLVAATTIATLFGDVTRRVRVAIFAGALLYAVQIGVGAATAVLGPAAVVPGLHLGLGLAIFTTIVLALAWDLELATGSETDDGLEFGAPTEVPTDEPSSPEPEPTPAADDTTTGRSLPESRLARARLTAFAYFKMMKPRLMWLLCLVAAAGMALAAGPALTLDVILATLGGGVLAIGASGTFNHVLERDVDKRMSRTSDRPLATELIPVRNAMLFGLFLTTASLSVFLTINMLAAALGLAAILFYSVVYTLLLKPNTVQNTVIGGLAGALPALIGWAAVTNEIGMPALALAGVIFLWTPAHFYNLALAYKDDYARGGFPMMPVVRGETETRKHIIYYLAATLASTVALAWITDLGALYAGTVVIFGGVFLWAAIVLHFEQTEAAAFRAFHASNAFLGAVLVAILVDALVVTTPLF
ncbi:protoheme IX geranylgeranyltransferase [Natrialba magadii ATCC 43099]|uniref:Protoheme IX farnesyltransferase n=1 Tax=Natrialba magadii (strain ATCC 43099 / DSM 3394 / CCM 3739 / CIP 104546 / IAM 13178 / JCM 8861 / NBRC 102185 / NCIMB 2190 / MS3) TaxID=547559 RepID=D3SWY3_NATMM|nr:heme o synthase [Natrialba magadii]ADD05865.1 protoheme IX geranylgeranyltransferase [Natrialba magadii ATCC 43099]ELY30627.1 protoheme IX farnesyltransferase [Natrialba magadii ATCC 43099]